MTETRARPDLATALSIAGSDPTGGAGMQADIQVFRHFGVHGMGVVTAITLQDSSKVHQVLPAFPSVVLDQLRVLLRDIRPGAVKLGMLATDDVVRNVMLGLGQLEPGTPLVIDPVLRASDGTPLLERRAWASLQQLCEMATLVTPNLAELEALAGGEVETTAGTETAARRWLDQTGTRALLVKGGHREGAPHDLLATSGDDGVELEWLPGERIDVGPVHGTGCALSAAITARLALGDELRTAVETARRFVAAGLGAATTVGGGARFLVHP